MGIFEDAFGNNDLERRVEEEVKRIATLEATSQVQKAVDSVCDKMDKLYEEPVTERERFLMLATVSISMNHIVLTNILRDEDRMMGIFEKMDRE